MKITDLFTLYGLDVIGLAIVCCAVTRLIKYALSSKSAELSKFFAFLPFICGIVMYSAYAAAVNGGFGYIVDHFADVAEKGISVGAATTLVCVTCARVKNDKSDWKAEVIAAVIAGFVAEGTETTVAEEILRRLADETGESALDLLSANAADGITQAEVEVLSALIDRMSDNFKNV